MNAFPSCFRRWPVLLVVLCLAIQARAADPEFEKIMAEVRAKAAAGDASAQFQVAGWLEQGTGDLGTQDEPRAIEFYKKCLAQGIHRAAFKLGRMYAEGRGSAKNPALAAKYMKEAAAAGENEAQCDLGLMYAEGGALPRDDAEALKWFRLAAAQQDGRAIYQVGHAYSLGRGVKKDTTEAARWLMLAGSFSEEQAVFELVALIQAEPALADELPMSIPDAPVVAAVAPTPVPSSTPQPNPAPAAMPAPAVAPAPAPAPALAPVVAQVLEKRLATEDDSLAAIARRFQTAFNAASALAGRERAVKKFSAEVVAAASEVGTSKAQLTEFVLHTLQPLMEQRLDEAGAYVMAIDSWQIDMTALPRVLPQNVLASIRSYSARVSANYNAEQNALDVFRAQIAPARAGNVTAQLQVAEGYLRGAAGSYTESFRRQAAYWFRQAQKQGQRQNDARLQQLVAPLLQQFKAAIEANDGNAAAAACAAMAETGDGAFAAAGAMFYLIGNYGTEKNEDTARYLFKRAVECGDAGSAPWVALLDAESDLAKRAVLAVANGEAALKQEQPGEKYARSESWFIYAATLGDSAAAARLKEIKEIRDLTKLAKTPGMMEFEVGRIAYEAKDYAKAMAAWKTAAEKGNADAIFNIGVMYRNGQGVVASLATAREWYVKAAAKDPAQYQKTLAEADDLIAHGAIEVEQGLSAYFDKKYVEARKLFQTSMEKGNAMAMYWLGVMALNGAGGPRDLLAARDWFNQAAAKGLAQGPADQLKLLEEAIAHGDLDQDVGFAAYTAKDYAKALASWTAGAAKGNADALFNLGILSQSGNGVTRDLAQAAAWYDKAAAAGNKNAKAAADKMRLALVGTDELDKAMVAYKAKHYPEAVAWWEKSANLGNVNAMTALGIFYNDGAGEIFADSDKAISWFKKAADQGDETAGQYLKSAQLLASLRALQTGTANKAPPPKGVSLVKGSKWTDRDVLAALKRGADHESLAVALRTDGIDYYYGDYLRLMQTPEAATIKEYGHLSSALLEGFKPGAGAWVEETARAAIAARRSQLKLTPRPVDSAELRARAKAGDAAAMYALFIMRPEQFKLGDLPQELRFSYADFAQLMLTKNYAPGLWIAAGTLVNQADKTKNDPVLRAEYLRRSAEAGDVRGANAYAGLFFAPGDVSVAPNFAEAEQWLIEAGARAESGDFTVMPPQLALTVLYSAQAPIGSSGTDLSPDDASLLWIRDLIRRGGRTAEHAQIVLESWRRARNPRPVDAMLKALPPEVAPWSAAEVSALETAAKKGDATAASKLAAAYESGRGVRQHDARAVELFTLAANKGSIPAMRALAVHATSGFGMKKNPAEILAWLEKAGAAGDATAWRELGDIFHWGRSDSGIKTDYPRALAAYEKAVAAGDAAALLWLGEMYSRGRGVPKDVVKAREFKKRAADAGHVPAFQSLARDYRDEKDFKNAAIWFQKQVDAGANLPDSLGELATALDKAGEGARAIPIYQKYLAQKGDDVQAWFALGGLQEKQGDFAGALVSYRTIEGNDSPYNFFKSSMGPAIQRVKEELNPTPGSMVTLRKQAEAGDAEAMLQLARLLSSTDKSAALDWLKKAAAKDYPPAMLVLAGETATKDKAGALALIQKAAALGNLEAKFRLGVLQMQGKEMPIDQPKGLALVIEAADGGLAAAQYEYGRALVVGAPGIPADPARGLGYLHKAVLQGVPQAAAILGECYERGLGGEVNLAQALRWYQEAVRGGLKQVEPALQRVQQQLNNAAKH